MVHHDLDYAGRRLRLMGSRMVETDKSGHRAIHTVEQHGDTPDQTHGEAKSDVPEFERTDTATNFELFYDLWFVANLNNFTSIHDISTLPQFTSFIGYMVLLWTTWLMTSLYDVRFSADSVLERCCKSIHLGVMVGFAELGTYFNPDDQILSVFRAMSLFLAMSRLVLAIQYGVVLLQVRRYADGRRPMLLTAAVHFVASVIYLGVSFQFRTGQSSRVFILWYVAGVLEMAVHLSLSQLSDVLTFVGTHLGERLNLLTLVIVGEGCMILAKSVTLLVKDTYVKDNTLTTWSATLIGTVTAATALIYIIFQLYFDWMHDEHSMSRRHQVQWTAIHLPFHIALTLLVEGANQFIVWARILESVQGIMDRIAQAQAAIPDYPTSQEISQALGEAVFDFLEKYPPPDLLASYDSVRERLAEIADIPDAFWTVPPAPSDDPTMVDFQQDVSELIYAMVNAVYNAFEIEAPEDVGAAGDTDLMQLNASLAIGQRFVLVYMYAFACAGIVLLFLTVMHVISKRRGWSPFNMVRTAACLLISIGLSLLAVIGASGTATFTDKVGAGSFVGSSWMLPTITLCYLVALVLTHVPHPEGLGMGRFRDVPHDEVEAQKQLRESHSLTDLPRVFTGRRRSRRVSNPADRRTWFLSRERYSSPSPSPSPPPPGYDGRKLSSSRSSSATGMSERPELTAFGQFERYQAADSSDYGTRR